MGSQYDPLASPNLLDYAGYGSEIDLHSDTPNYPGNLQGDNGTTDVTLDQPNHEGAQRFDEMVGTNARPSGYAPGTTVVKAATTKTRETIKRVTRRLKVIKGKSEMYRKMLCTLSLLVLGISMNRQQN